ncbi:MAG: response regulator transcription factor [Gallionella sp.]|nr:response regulator transcription factor [Gallionella sp.]
MATRLNIIVVEDHDALRELTVDALREQGHQVVGGDCAEALVDLTDMHADLMVIDLNLPGEDGISLSRRLRSINPGIGIIMLTARGSLAEKMEGYESGADIYLTKPVSSDELGAAVMALARRLGHSIHPPSTLKLNKSKLSLQGDDGEVALSVNEVKLLAAFAYAPEHRLENWEVIQVLGKSLDQNTKSSLVVQITRLRKKLTQAGCDNKSIRSIRGFGYQLCVKVNLV